MNDDFFGMYQCTHCDAEFDAESDGPEIRFCPCCGDDKIIGEICTNVSDDDGDDVFVRFSPVELEHLKRGVTRER